jgi:hypothetical protein
MLAVATSAHAQKRFERMMTAFNQAETLSSNIQILSQQPIPKEIAGTPAKVAAWNQQTASLDSIRMKIDSYARSLTEAMKDGQVTRQEWNQMVVACGALSCRDTNAGSVIGPIARRQEEACSLLQALCNNEVID